MRVVLLVFLLAVGACQPAPEVAREGPAVTTPSRFAGDEAMGEFQFRNPASTEYKIIPAAEACCCRPPCECPEECPEDYELRIILPTGHGEHVVTEEGPSCGEGPGGRIQWDHFYYVDNFPSYAYEIAATMYCEIDPETGKAVYTIAQLFNPLIGFESGTCNADYIVPTCDPDTKRPAGQTIEQEEFCFECEYGDPPEIFPFDLEIIDNPLP